jgi:hypothetical protein
MPILTDHETATHPRYCSCCGLELVPGVTRSAFDPETGTQFEYPVLRCPGSAARKPGTIGAFLFGGPGELETELAYHHDVVVATRAPSGSDGPPD